MVDDVQQRRRERERAPGARAGGREHDRGAEPERDDPDVLDRREREQALELALHERVEDPAEGRQEARAQQHGADPQRRRAVPREQHPDQPVERDLHHHRRHQRRDVGRRDRVGARQPGVQRHQPGLRAEADERRHGDERLQPARRRRAAERPGVREHEQRDPDADAAEVADREVDEDGAAHGPVASGDEDRAGRHERHQLPAGEERDRVAGGQHRRERQHEGRRERGQRTTGDARVAQPVARGEQRRQRDDGDEREEQRAQPVEAERRRERVVERGADRDVAHEDGGGAGGEQDDAGDLHVQRALDPAGRERGDAPQRDERAPGDDQRAHRSGRDGTCAARTP